MTQELVDEHNGALSKSIDIFEAYTLSEFHFRFTFYCPCRLSQVKNDILRTVQPYTCVIHF